MTELSIFLNFALNFKILKLFKNNICLGSSLDLLNLQKIFLRQCNIREVNGRCFQGMTNLVELDLSYNLLQSIPQDALSDCQFLMILSLTGNPIREVSRAQLAPLKYLQTLDLSACQIVEIEAQAFVDLKNLLWLQLENNLIERLDPESDLPKNTRGISFNGNRWKCDCKLIGLRDFLQNRTVSFQVDPICSSPERISGQLIRELPDYELACIPKVSPSSSFEEVISGKNISLVCMVDSIPSSIITWRYEGLQISNGSTMVSDIDLRSYYFTTTRTGPGVLTSELFLLRTSKDDNGRFQCEAENKAGKAIGNFSVIVVKPEPPFSPEAKKVEEERFKREYFVVIGVAAIIISILTITISMILIVKCRRVRRNCPQTGPHLYQCSINNSTFSSDKTLMTIQTSKPNCIPDETSEYAASYTKNELSYEQMMDESLNKNDIIPADKFPNGPCSILKKSYSIVSFRDPTIVNIDKSEVTLFNHIIHKEPQVNKDIPLQTGRNNTDSITTLQSLHDVKLSNDIIVEEDIPVFHSTRTSQLLLLESNEGEEIRAGDGKIDNHWHFSTLPKKKFLKESSGVSDKLSLNLQHFIPIQRCEELILPPPPQFKEYILYHLSICEVRNFS